MFLRFACRDIFTLARGTGWVMAGLAACPGPCPGARGAGVGGLAMRTGACGRSLQMVDGVATQSCLFADTHPGPGSGQGHSDSRADDTGAWHAQDQGASEAAHVSEDESQNPCASQSPSAKATLSAAPLSKQVKLLEHQKPGTVCQHNPGK